jgi:hypothetical protein
LTAVRRRQAVTHRPGGPTRERRSHDFTEQMLFDAGRRLEGLQHLSHLIHAPARADVHRLGQPGVQWRRQRLPRRRGLVGTQHRFPGVPRLGRNLIKEVSAHFIVAYRVQ